MTKSNGEPTMHQNSLKNDRRRATYGDFSKRHDPKAERAREFFKTPGFQDIKEILKDE